jgi:hypothetical protein
MLQFFYSNSEKNSIFKDTSKSLGGFVSTNMFLNGKINSLFPKTYSNSTDVRLIIIKNVGLDTINFSLNLESDSLLIDYKYALVAPYLDSCGNIQFEQITEESEPIYASFISEESTLSLESNKIIGVWLKRFKKEIIDTAQKSLECGGDLVNLNINDKHIESLSLVLNIQ